MISNGSHVTIMHAHAKAWAAAKQRLMESSAPMHA